MPNIQTYKEDPAQYVSDCYREFAGYYDEHIKDADEEAKGLFCNYSRILEEHKKDEWLDMSTYFSPLVQPHVLSRVAQFVATLLSADPVVKWLPMPGTPMENAKRMQDAVLSLLLGDHMQRTVRLTELLTAAELRKEAWVKLTVKPDEQTELTLEDSLLDLAMSPEELASMGISLPPPTEPLKRGVKRTLKTVQGEMRPSWDLLPDRAFIREPYPWRKEDWLYCGDHKWVSEAYLRDAERRGVYSNINEAIQAAGGGTGAGSSYPDDTVFNLQSSGKTHNEPDNFSYDAMSKRSTPAGQKSRYEHSHHLIELWAVVPVKRENPIELPPPHSPRGYEPEWTGETEVRVITTVNGVLVANRPKKEPYLQIQWPYVQFKAITVPNQMEGLSIGEVEAPLQHIENEIYNQRLDAGRYLLFTPLQMDSQCHVLNDAVWAPNRIWKVQGLNQHGGVKPIMNPQSAQMISAFQGEQGLNRTNAENLVAATDLIQGSRNVKTDRTLGETQIRHQGTVSRLNLTLVNYAAGLMEICDGMEKMLQELVPLDRSVPWFTGQWNEQGQPIQEQLSFSGLKGRFKKTMAHVSEYVDAINEKLLWDLVMERLAGDPLFMTPERHYKLVRRYLEAYRVPELDDLLGLPPMLPTDQMGQLLMAIFGGMGQPGQGRTGVARTPQGLGITLR